MIYVHLDTNQKILQVDKQVTSPGHKVVWTLIAWLVDG